MRSAKWEVVYDVLRKRIEDGIYPPGSDFPTNNDLISEFKVQTVTLQQAINTLIREGLLISLGSRNARRKVRSIPHRSNRACGFTNDSPSLKPRKELLELKILSTKDEIPTYISAEMKLPILYYKVNQWRDDVLVAVSESYIPNYIPQDELLLYLQKENASLYQTLTNLGFHPTTCEETLVVQTANKKDIQALGLPHNSLIPIVHIHRKTFDKDEKLVEYCILADRSDYYEFSYRFNL